MGFGDFKDKAQGFINHQLGLNTEDIYPKDLEYGNNEPWLGITDTEDPFFARQRIDARRWSKVYPYRLVVWDVKKNTVVKSNGGNVGLDTLETKYFKHGTQYTVTQTLNNTDGWVVELPITPQQLVISDQFSINTSATMRGIVEEHNGVRFKLIAAQGTTGFWPSRPTQGGEIESPTILGSLFGGTLEAATNVMEGVDQFQSAFTNNHANQLSKPEAPDLYQTGYYQAQLLGQFFERYAQEKKKAKNKHWRLVLDMPKQNQSFVVTPVNFSLTQDQQDPTLIKFSFQLKAWKRIDLSGREEDVSPKKPSLTPNVIQRVITAVNGARATLGAVTNLIKAVRSDFRAPFDILRQTSLAVKDLGGLAYSVADLAPSIREEYKSSIKESLFIAKNSFQRGVDKGGAGISTGSTVTSTGVNIKSQTLTAKAGAAVNAIAAEKEKHEGLSDQAVADGALGEEASQSQQTSALNNVFQSPEENFELFDSMDVDELSLTPEQRNLIDDELELVRLITIDDLREYRNELESLMLDISNYYGTGDETYAEVYGKSTPKERATPMTIEENEILTSLMDAIQSYDLLISTKSWDDNKNESSLEYVGGLANESDISFENYNAKYLAPIPFGLTIEEISARYLGDPDQWIEIVTLNNLRSPYIDEDGFIYNFLSNAEGRQFNIDDSEGKIFIGQTLTFSSDTVPQFTRNVVNVEEIDDNNYLITVDGLDDMGKLTTADNAKVQGYLPGTVNSQNQIYIPINATPEEDDKTFEIPSLDEKHLTKLSKIDWLLTDDGDVAINSVGDLRLSNGLTNLVQAVKLKVRTKRGTLLRHLNYGLGLQHGISIADIDNGSIIQSLNEMIKEDKRFSSIERIDVKLIGSTMSISMAIKLANQSGILPIDFEI